MTEASGAYFWRQHNVAKMSISALARNHDESYEAIDHAIQRYERRARERNAAETARAQQDAIRIRYPGGWNSKTA